jgi:hypothetical protein
MSKLTKGTEENLRQAMAENDSILIRSIILAAANISLPEACEAFDYAVDGGDPYKIIEDPAPDFIFDANKEHWDRDYFFNHTQRMMRNFSRAAFEHFLEVGKQVFPERMKPMPDLSAENTPPPSLPPGCKIERKNGVSVVMIGAAIVGIILLGVIIYLIAGGDRS